MRFREIFMQFGNGFIPTNLQLNDYSLTRLLYKIKFCFIVLFFLYPLFSIIEIILYLFTDEYSVIFLFTSYFIMPFCLFFWIFINKILKIDFDKLKNRKLLKVLYKFLVAYLIVSLCLLFFSFILCFALPLNLGTINYLAILFAIFSMISFIPLYYFDKIQKQILLLFPKNEKESKRTIPVKTYNNLIDKTGKRFFVKYYYQLKNWATYDLIEIIEENISANEKEKRILYGKKIFNSNLNIYALEQIIYNSENKIDQNTIIKAKEIYKEERLIK